MVLGGLVWVFARSRTDITPRESPVALASVANVADTAHDMPPNVVTMLGVPEVILSATPSDSEPEGKLAPQRDEGSNRTELADRNPKSQSESAAPARKPPTNSARRTADTFLVKPQ